MPLIRTPNIADPDGFYEELIAAQRQLHGSQAAHLLEANEQLVLAAVRAQLDNR